MKIDENCTSTNCSEDKSKSMTLDDIKNLQDVMLIEKLKQLDIPYIIQPYVEKPIVMLPSRFEKLLNKD